MKKVLIHAYTEQNLGDDMFVEYLCTRYPLVSFYIICQNRYRAAFNAISNLTILSPNESHCFSELCTQIVIGGSIFMQSKNKNILKKYSDDKKRILSNIPAHIIGANFGPYKSHLFFFLYKHWFKKLEEITFRDEYSYNLFRLNNMRWAPDILFNYNLPVISTKKTVSISCIKKNKRSGLKEYNEYLYFLKLVHIIEHYSRDGFKILLACFSKVQEDDIAAKKIYNLLTPQVQATTEILIYTGDIRIFFKKFLSSSYIIGTRFHSIILGWSAGIPTFPICYNEKSYNAINSYGFKGNIADIDNVYNLDFSYIDLNRTTNSKFDLHNIRNRAENHFFELDKLLME